MNQDVCKLALQISNHECVQSSRHISRKKEIRMRWEGLESIPYQNRVATLFNHQILLFVQTMQTDYTYCLNDESCVFLLLSFCLNYVLHNTYHLIRRLFRFYKLNKTDYLNQSLISIEQIQFDEDNRHKIIKMCLLHTPWYPLPPKRTLASKFKLL